MTERCIHPHIKTWVGPAGNNLWQCAECGLAFAPFDVARETDAERYRWLVR